MKVSGVLAWHPHVAMSKENRRVSFRPMGGATSDQWQRWLSAPSAVMVLLDGSAFISH